MQCKVLQKQAEDCMSVGARTALIVASSFLCGNNDTKAPTFMPASVFKRLFISTSSLVKLSNSAYLSLERQRTRCVSLEWQINAIRF